MKKTLVAIAALTAVSAFAQSSVTVSGAMVRCWLWISHNFLEFEFEFEFEFELKSEI